MSKTPPLTSANSTLTEPHRSDELYIGITTLFLFEVSLCHSVWSISLNSPNSATTSPFIRVIDAATTSSFLFTKLFKVVFTIKLSEVVVATESCTASDSHTFLRESSRIWSFFGITPIKSAINNTLRVNMTRPKLTLTAGLITGIFIIIILLFLNCQIFHQRRFL